MDSEADVVSLTSGSIGGGASGGGALSDLSAIGRWRGPWDASAGIPTAPGSTISPGETIKAGDRWLVSTPGTIAGIGGGDDLGVGDIIVATADSAAVAADFTTLEVNKGDVPSAISDNQVLATLPAETATTVTFAGLTRVLGVEVEDSAGKIITSDLVVTRSSDNIYTLESSVSLAGLILNAWGV